MNHYLSVKELREALENVPDHLPVVINICVGEEEDKRALVDGAGRVVDRRDLFDIDSFNIYCSMQEEEEIEEHQ